MVSQHLVVGCQRPEARAQRQPERRPSTWTIPSSANSSCSAGPDRPGGAPTLLFCDNETNCGRLYGVASSPPYPKDGINDHVVAGAATVNPELRGTKCAAWYRLTVEPGATVEVRLRLRPQGASPNAASALGNDFEE